VTGWRVSGEIVVDLERADEATVESATRELGQVLRERGGKASYAAGMITVEMLFRSDLSYVQSDAHSEAVRMITQALEEFGLSSYSFRWTRVTPEPVYED
jgi:hypothetical protein